MDKFKVLFIGPHPDDIDYGCAISIYNHYSKGDEITVIVLSEGDMGGDSSERIAEQGNSLKILAPNSRNIMLSFPDTQLFYHMNVIINQIRAIVLENIPDIVYIPSAKDSHQDHLTAHNCAMAVFNTIKVKKILCYETPSTLPSFSPNLLKFYDNEKFKVKLNALQCHKSQIGKPYFSTETIFSIAKMRAAQGKCFNGLAEAYEVVRINEF